jgi:hypothetical protein
LACKRLNGGLWSALEIRLASGRVRASTDTVTLLFTDIGDGVAECLEQIACLLVSLDRADVARRLAGAAAALRETLEMPVASPADEARLDLFLGRARVALGEDAFAAAYAAGGRLTQDEAAAEALEAVE